MSEISRNINDFILEQCEEFRRLETEGYIRRKLMFKLNDGQGVEPMRCVNHLPVQHRDGKPPWCNGCGLTENHEHPESSPQPVDSIVVPVIVDGILTGQADVRMNGEITLKINPDQAKALYENVITGLYDSVSVNVTFSCIPAKAVPKQRPSL